MVEVGDPLGNEALDLIREQLDAGDRSAVPELLEVGFSNTVVRFGGSVVRVARNDEAGSKHQLEATLLALLSDRLPVSVPGPVRLVAARGPVEHGAAIHPFLDGRTLEPADVSDSIATGIARTLATLHALPVGTVAWLDLPRLEPVSEIRRLRGELDTYLAVRLGERRHGALTRWLSELERSLQNHERVLCHADAWFGNMLIDGERLVALLDWEDACFADPAVDLAAQLHLAEGADAVLSAYAELRPTGGRLGERMRGYALIRQGAGLAYVLRNDISEELDEEVAKLASLIE